MIISPPFIDAPEEGQSDDAYIKKMMVPSTGEPGFFPVSKYFEWHGGVHLKAPGSTPAKKEGKYNRKVVDNGFYVRAIADAEVVYVREPLKEPSPSVLRKIQTYLTTEDVEKRKQLENELTDDEKQQVPLVHPNSGWSDNGVVILRHVTEIGEQSEPKPAAEAPPESAAETSPEPSSEPENFVEPDPSRFQALDRDTGPLNNVTPTRDELYQELISPQIKANAFPEAIEERVLKNITETVDAREPSNDQAPSDDEVQSNDQEVVDNRISYYSMYIHLCEVDVKKGDKILRKSILGAPGKIYGESNVIHFEIIADDQQLSRIVGSLAYSNNKTDEVCENFKNGKGRSGICFGAACFHIPAGTPLYAGPHPHAYGDPASLPGFSKGTLDQDIVVTMDYVAGKCTFKIYDTEGTLLGTHADQTPALVEDMGHASQTPGYPVPPPPKPAALTRQGALGPPEEMGRASETPSQPAPPPPKPVAPTRQPATPTKPSIKWEPITEYTLYKASLNRFPDCPSAGFQLLRFGRILDETGLTANQIAGIKAAPHLRHLTFTVPGAGSTTSAWINLNDPSIQKYSDADFPPWMGWRVDDTDTNSDTRCESSIIHALAARGKGTVPPNPTAPNTPETPIDSVGEPGVTRNAENRPENTSPPSDVEGSSDPAATAVPPASDPPADDTWLTEAEYEALSPLQKARRLMLPEVQNKLQKMFFKFPTQWKHDESGFKERYGWLIDLVCNSENASDGGETNDTETQKFVARTEAWLKDHHKALCFWDDAAIEGIDGSRVSDNHWHIPPVEFIRHMRKCMWLSPNEMLQLFPKGRSYNPDVKILKDYGTVLNWTTRKYNITTPMRMAAFYANSIQETAWFDTMAENYPDNYWYFPWYGRGFKQLTHPYNYGGYWDFRNKWAFLEATEAQLEEIKAEFEQLNKERKETKNGVHSDVRKAFLAATKDCPTDSIPNQLCKRRKNRDVVGPVWGDARHPNLTELFHWRCHLSGKHTKETTRPAGDRSSAQAAHDEIEKIFAPADSAGYYWAKNTVIRKADGTGELKYHGKKEGIASAPFVEVCKAINGATIGLDDRAFAYARTLDVLTEVRFPGGTEHPRNHPSRPYEPEFGYNGNWKIPE